MELALPAFEYRMKKRNGSVLIYDIIRKKYVSLTPEEWVRQHIIHFLIEHKSYPASLVAVEKEIDLYGLRRRFDLVCYDRQGEPYLIIECKAPSVELSQKVFDQVFGYNLIMVARYIAITNGVKHYCGYVDSNRSFSFLDEIPSFEG